jgi:hypothetical protein
MALIVDPDSLNDGTEIVISTANKTVRLVATGNLSNDGVTIKCVYSKLKELWKASATYIKSPFPMTPITDEQFEMVNDWDWYDDTTRYLLRTGGWAVKDSSGVSLEEWAGIISLGSIGSSDQAYFQQVAAAASTNFQLTGPVNQAVKVYGDATHGNFDYRSHFAIFCRIYQKSYALSQLSDIGVTTLSYQAYRFPLANAADIKITHNDTAVDGDAPYTGMSITWYASAQQRDIGGTDRDFHIIIDGNSGTAEEIYEFVQRALRKTSDIDDGAGTKIGNVTSALLKFVGDTLYTQLQSEGGVFIDNYVAADINRLVFVDDTGTERTFPYTSALTISFGDNLKNDADAIYSVFFTTNPSGNFGTDNAVVVDDADDADMSGSVGGSSSVQLTFAYDTNNQGGRTPATDAAITVVGIGLETGQYVKATGTIQRSNSNSVSLVAPLERNYQNPA